MKYFFSRNTYIAIEIISNLVVTPRAELHIKLPGRGFSNNVDYTDDDVDDNDLTKKMMLNSQKN